MFLLCYRRFLVPPNAILAKGCLAHNNRHCWDASAMFLDLSLLADVSHSCFHRKVRCSQQVLSRSSNNYVTSLLILTMLAAVCQSNLGLAMCINTSCASWGVVWRQP